MCTGRHSRSGVGFVENAAEKTNNLRLSASLSLAIIALSFTTFSSIGPVDINGDGEELTKKTDEVAACGERTMFGGLSLDVLEK